MADPLAEFRVGASPQITQPQSAAPTVNAKGQPLYNPQAPAGPSDYLAEFRVDSGFEPNIRRENNSLGDEFAAGLGAGIDGMQGSLYGLAGLVGRELGIDWMEDAGNKGAEEQFGEAARATRQSAGFTDIDSAGGFFRWASASLGEAIPSLATMMTGAGIGGIAGKKTVELAVKRSLAQRVERGLVGQGFGRAEAMDATRGMLNTPTGQKMVRDAFINGERVIAPATAAARATGQRVGGVAAATAPIVGAIDQELVAMGVDDPGLTALVAGVGAGALEALPALRLLGKMFPGVDAAVSKTFVKDFAVATGTQMMLEGSTEAAQEMITLAAMSYHDPSFDMFSPDAKKRVIDAFAAGGIVGAVTGGGAEAIGHLQTRKEGIKKAVKPTIAAWVMSEPDEGLPEGFTPADKSVYAEIKDRVYSTVQPAVEAAVNSMRNQMQNVSDLIDKQLEGGANADVTKVSDVVKQAHEKFIAVHGDQIAQAKEYLDKQIKFIYETAETIKDPAERERFIADHVDATKQKIAGFVETLRKAAAKRDETTQAEVDNMDFDGVEGFDFEPGQEDVIDETERRVGPSGREFDRSVGPSPEPAESTGVVIPEDGEVDAKPTIVFGKNQQTATVGVDGTESVQGYDNQNQARKGLKTLRKMFPESTDSDFEIVKKDGKFTIETVNPELRETHTFNQAQRAARDSAARTKNNARNNRRKFKLPRALIEKLGLKIKEPTVDIITLAMRGKNIDPQAKSLRDGMQAMIGDMIARGYLDSDSATAMLAQFDKHFGDVADASIEAFAPVGSFPTKGVAQAEMINFIETLKERDIRVPFKMFDVRENEDGSWGFGIEDPIKFRALRAKSPKEAAALLTALKDHRRQDKLADAAREENEFSGNAALGGQRPTQKESDIRRVVNPRTPDTDASRATSGDLGDTRGATAGTARTTTKIARDSTGSRIIQDTDPQADDRQTDPKTKPKEFDDRSDPSVQNRRRRANQNAKELSAWERRILARIGRPAKTKVLIDNTYDVTNVKNLEALVSFVQKKLGLNNDIVVMDDLGLRHLIDSGAVSDPVFKQTLEDPNVHARNIRIGNTSYVYLSPKVLSDPNLTVLAMGHELGHHLYSVAWDNLTPEAQADLKKASGTKTEAEFNEWMADQLAAWILNRRAPKGAVESFFAKVAGKIRQLYEFIAGNERFELNETFADFADAVATKASNAASPGANPFNDAVMKQWFKNDGVTMYKWWGELPSKDNMEIPKPLTVGAQKALDRISDKYPAIAKRAVTIRNWTVQAFKLAVAPSTEVMRSLGKRVAAANELVAIFNRAGHGKAKESNNYHQSIELMKGQFIKPLRALIQTGISVERLAEIARSLHIKDGDPNATFTKEEQVIRTLFDTMHDYATKAGLPVRKVANYFPRSFSREKLIAEKQKVLDHLTDGVGMPLEKARAFYNSLIDPNATDGRATQDATETPGFKNMNSREAQDKFFDQYLDTNLEGVVLGYINAVVKRAEFNKLLGEAMPVTELSAKEAISAGIWDPKAKMHRILKTAKKEGATDAELVIMEKYIDANLGQLGRDDVKPGMRRFMAGIMAYQNMRVLMFTVFASLPDMAGPAIRSGSMKEAFKSFKANIDGIAKNDSDLADMARAYGIISDTASEHIMTEYVDNNHMPAKLRKWNDAFFKWTGLNYYTDFTRKAALAVGIDYIQRMHVDSIQGKDERTRFRGRDALKEMGLAEGDVSAWIIEGKPSYDSVSNERHKKIAQALVQFVDESIMRPNASQRPIMASHPAAMLVFHLKGYMYAISDITLGRMWHNTQEAKGIPETLAAMSPALLMIALTAVGLELRELIQYAGSSRKPRTDSMDGWEYTTELITRSGLPGYGQLLFDLNGAEDRGMSPLAGVGGPALSQMAEWMSKPSTQTIPKAIPIIGQLPAGREAVRNVL